MEQSIGLVTTDNSHFPDEHVNFVVDSATFQMLGINTSKNKKIVSVEELKQPAGESIKSFIGASIVTARVNSNFDPQSGGDIFVSFRMNFLGTKWKTFDLVAKLESQKWTLYDGGRSIHQIHILFQGGPTPQEIRLE